MSHIHTLMVGSHGRAAGLLVLVAALAQFMTAAVVADEQEDKQVQALITEFNELLAAGQGQQAMQHLQRVRQRHGEHALVLTAVGRLQMMQNNVQGAIASLTQALEKQPHEPVASALLANIDFRMARGEQAQQRIDAALKLHPESPELLIVAAQIKMAQQDAAGAQPLFQKVADNMEAPKDLRAQAYAQLGSILVHQEKPAEAVEVLKKALGMQWHPDIALAVVVQSEKAGDYQGTLKAINNFTMMLMYPQYKQISDRAMQQLRPIERRAKVQEIDAILAEGDHVKAKERMNTLTRELKRDAKVWEEFRPQINRLEVIQRTQVLEEGLGQDKDINWLTNMVYGLKTMAAGQQGEHVDRANAAMAKAQARIDAAAAKEIPAILELVKNGALISDLDFPDPELKKVLEEKGLKPYKEMSVAAREALREHFEPLLAARLAPPFEEHILPYLEKPTDAALRQALLTSFMEQAATFDVTAEGAKYQQLIPDWVWTGSGKHGPALPKALNDQREKAYTVWNNLGTYDLEKAGKWDEVIEGYGRAIAVYPRREVLVNRAYAYVHNGNFQAAWEDMALAAAITMYEVAASYRRGVNDLQADTFVLNYLGQAQALKALAEGRRVTEGPGANAAFVDVLDDIRNERWLEAAEFVSAEHRPGTIEAWYVGQLRFNPRPEKTSILNALAAAAEATDDPERQNQLVELADPLGSYLHPVFTIIRARAETDDDKRLKLLESAASGGPRHAEASILLAQLMEKRGQARDALVQYNVAAMGMTVNELKEADRQEAARQRDRLAQSLRGNAKDWDFYLSLYNEYSKEMYANMRSRLIAARTEALMNRMLGLNAKRLPVLLSRADARRFIDDHQGALEDLEEAEKAMQGHERLPNVYAGIAECHLKLGNQAKAMEYFTRSIDGGFKSLANFQKRGDLHRAAGNTVAALADYSAAIEINANDSYSLLKRSEIYEYQLEDFDKALADLEKLKALNEAAGRSNTIIDLRLLSVRGRLLDRQFR